MSYETRRALVLVAGGFLIGGGLGYILAQHRLESKYRGWANEEIDSVKEVYKRRYKEQPYSDPTSTAETLIASPNEPLQKVDYSKIVVEENYIASSDSSEKAVAPRVEPLANPELYDSGTEPKWDPANRSSDEPYPITVDEFMEDERFDKIVISYYEGDNTLADEKDSIIPDIEGTVGEANLLLFGQGSKDKNVVYVRNEKLRADFEVCLEDGSYSVMVLGMHEEYLQHEDRGPRVRKMRDDRDSG